jgi:hypothetical protein
MYFVQFRPQPIFFLYPFMCVSMVTEFIRWFAHTDSRQSLFGSLDRNAWAQGNSTKAYKVM